MQKELENICLSLELSQKIQEIGINIEKTYARWVIISQKIIYRPETDGIYLLRSYADDWYEANRKLGGIDIKAPTYEGLWPYLPQEIEKNGEIYWLEQVKGDESGVTVIRYISLQYDILKWFESRSLVELAAKMLIWLHESGYIEKGE